MTTILKLEIIGLWILLSAIWLSISYGTSELSQDKLTTLEQAVSDYSKDYGVWDCYLNWEKTSLAGIVLWITSSESGYWTYWLGAKHNNRGNLKLAQQYPLPKQSDKKSYVHWDGGKYYIYDSAYDWIYDIAHWVNTKGKSACNVTTRTFTIFIKWTTNISATQKQAVERHVNNLTEVAQAYDSWKPIYVINNEDTQDQADTINWLKKGTPLKVKPSKECRQVATISKDDSYIQADTMFWEFINWIRNLDKGTKIFVCRDL